MPLKNGKLKTVVQRKYVTPSTNNKTLDKNEKMEKFEEHDERWFRVCLSLQCHGSVVSVV